MSVAQEWDPDLDGTASQSGGIGSIEGHRVIGITDPQAPVTVIDRLAYYVQSGAAGAEAGVGPGQPPRLVPKDILAGLRTWFVEPPGFRAVVERLRVPGTVVISGQRGNGKRSAALMALAQSGNGSDRFRELPDDAEGDFSLDVTAIEEGERLMLDLSAETDEPAPGNVAVLRSYRAVVAERGAYLAIVLSPEHQHIAEMLGAPVLDIGRPDGDEVFRQHLRALDVPVHELDSGRKPLSDRLAYDPMREIAALAELVWRTRSAARGAGTWQDWLRAALVGSEAQLDSVAKLLRENRDGRGRALLLAAAVFEYSTPDVVAHGANTLLQVVGYPEPEEHRLQRADIAESLRDFDAKIDRDRRICFGTVTYGHAVRTHFWNTFPDLRADLRRWIDRSLRPPSVPRQDRVEALLRYTEQCLLIGYPGDLCLLVESWAKLEKESVRYLLDAAGPALTRGLLHEQHGRYFRRRVYDWSQTRTLWPGLATLLIGLCEAVVAPAQPQQALVRLRHFTRHRSSTVVDAARAALSSLSQDSRFAWRLLDRVHSDLTSGQPPHPADYAVFADLVEPKKSIEPLLRNVHARAQLHEAWRVVLQEQPVVIQSWLAAHGQDPGNEHLLDILAAAAGHEPHLTAVLYAATRDWVKAAVDQSDRQARLRTAVLLQHKVSTDSTPRQTKEGVAL